MKNGLSNFARAGAFALAMITGATGMSAAAPYTALSGNAPATSSSAPTSLTPKLVVDGELRGGNGAIWRRGGDFRRGDFRRGGWRDGDRSWRGDRRSWRGDRNWRGDRGWRRGWRDGDRRYSRRYRDRDYLGSAAVLGLGLGLLAAPRYYEPEPRYYAPQRRVYRQVGGSHVQWCYNRYRSYRASDNTFQPYNGPRQQCYSPY